METAAGNIDKLIHVEYINIAGCDCFKRWWKYYHRKSGAFLGLAYAQAETKMGELIAETKFNIQ